MTEQTTQGRSSQSNNRDRILAASLELFNERGALAVSTNAIAAHLGISPGNLYYHFENKEQIIREHYSNYSEFRELIARTLRLPPEGEAVQPSQLAGFFMSAVDAIWEYRFIYRDLDGLVVRDPEFARIFRSDVEWGRSRLSALFTSIIDGSKIPAKPTERELERLCTNIQLVQVSWISFLSTVRGILTLKRSDVAEGGLHAFAVLEPYLERGVRQEGTNHHGENTVSVQRLLKAPSQQGAPFEC